jgi:hypothetical protein
LSPEEADLLIGVVNTNAWLQHVLLEGKLTIKRLQKLFGVTTEKCQDFKDEVEAALPLSVCAYAINHSQQRYQYILCKHMIYHIFYLYLLA